MQRRFPITTGITATTATLLLLLLAGCGKREPAAITASTDAHTTHTTSTELAKEANSVLRLASTTSTRDSGLLDVLLPVFENQHHCRVDLIAVGTGAALKLGETGDADAVLVHARSAEEAFVAARHGVRHEPVMHNYFLIAGPADDPAGAKGSDAVAALNKIAAGKHRFISRGDDSGTHKREQSLWERVGGRPVWGELIESGQGMGPTLIMADEMKAYVLTDEATWLKQSERFQLVSLVREAPDLQNPYAVMVVNPDRHPGVNASLANDFVDFLISRSTQKLIDEYRVDGHRFFHADRLAEESSE
ncbi:MAG: substrate-binding domain-containing protein [Planctomycetota bacterium]|nr:substrate-binding domain-containing protein [Planctomycetota bacterium]